MVLRISNVRGLGHDEIRFGTLVRSGVFPTQNAGEFSEWNTVGVKFLSCWRWFESVSSVLHASTCTLNLFAAHSNRRSPCAACLSTLCGSQLLQNWVHLCIALACGCVNPFPRLYKSRCCHCAWANSPRCCGAVLGNQRARLLATALELGQLRDVSANLFWSCHLCRLASLIGKQLPFWKYSLWLHAIA